MTEGGEGGGPLDVPTLEVIGRRATSHPLVDDWAFEPDVLSPRRLALLVDDSQYPAPVQAARLDVRWYHGGQYSIHYVETRAESEWQCRWDRHPKPRSPMAHFHPPPNGSGDVQPSGIETTHHIGVIYAVLEWVAERVSELHDS